MAKMLYAVVGLVCGIALVATCGSSSSIKKTIMTDLGIAPADAQMSASSSMVLSAACDKVVMSGTSIEATYAELATPGVKPSDAPHVSAIVCGVPRSCPGCTGYQLPSDGCQGISPIVATDKIVVYCGTTDASVAAAAKAYVRVN